MVCEFVEFVAAGPLLAWVPWGDRHPVLMVPPFGLDDSFTVALWVLASKSSRVHRWGLSRNLMRTPPRHHMSRPWRQWATACQPLVH